LISQSLALQLAVVAFVMPAVWVNANQIGVALLPSESSGQLLRVVALQLPLPVFLHLWRVTT
jgi:hypothetical protein